MTQMNCEEDRKVDGGALMNGDMDGEALPLNTSHHRHAKQTDRPAEFINQPLLMTQK